MESSFKSVKIGQQVWMVRNLDVDTFRNGDPIPEIKSAEEWKKAGEEGKPAWCYYNNDPDNDKKYGKLYNWYAVNDPRELAPIGWHVPWDEEWKVLEMYLGMSKSEVDVSVWRDNDVGDKLKSTNSWKSGIDNSNGSNSSGFSALPGGCRYEDGKFDSIGYLGYWWSSTDSGRKDAWNRDLSCTNSIFGRYFYDKRRGISVRLERD